ncbi:hypothetical protein QMK19_25310 [Streptomyces sp. H10-C2]|uniref:hypothetical protein n=1 Tax=unclassified Streptomyces TaxID=2593676 RepID=UPI0024B98195|nr:MULTISPECIES: hypothetical protein [unclassified Streptomyces]MDJ0343331.1 hypothetical protein [Streptomyces sp. PH10-H1]MDJ0372884.1 hypothetical protein [Streptomyces sp. H10-C2]
MLSLRVARGSAVTVLLRRLLVAAASAGTGFLLLSALGYAMGHPGHSAASATRLAWCVVPFAAAVQVSVAVSRTEPSGRLHAGLAAAGLGRTGVPVLGAATTALSCGLGSVIALLVFLRLRGGLAGLDGTASGALGQDRPLPVAGVLTLLAAVPLLATAASAASLWPRRTAPTAAASADADDPGTRSAVTAPAGLSWGAALTAIGLVIEVSTDDLRHSTAADLLPLPGGLGQVAPAVLAGWVLTAAGMVLAGPGLVHACGRLLALHRPGVLRLLAGRALQEESRRTGRPLAVLCAVASGALAAIELNGTGSRPFGPLTGFAAALIAVCTVTAAVTAVIEAGRTREHSTAALVQLGAPAGLLRAAAALRCAVVLAVAFPLAAVIAQLAASPLTA